MLRGSQLHLRPTRGGLQQSAAIHLLGCGVCPSAEPDGAATTSAHAALTAFSTERDWPLSVALAPTACSGHCGLLCRSVACAARFFSYSTREHRARRRLACSWSCRLYWTRRQTATFTNSPGEAPSRASRRRSRSAQCHVFIVNECYGLSKGAAVRPPATAAPSHPLRSPIHQHWQRVLGQTEARRRYYDASVLHANGAFRTVDADTFFCLFGYHFSQARSAVTTTHARAHARTHAHSHTNTHTHTHTRTHARTHARTHTRPNGYSLLPPHSAVGAANSYTQRCVPPHSGSVGYGCTSVCASQLTEQPATAHAAANDGSGPVSTREYPRAPRRALPSVRCFGRSEYAEYP